MLTEQLIRVGMVNFAPDDARTPIEPIIAIWEQIENFFSNYKIVARAHDISKVAEYLVDLDASQVIDNLRLTQEYKTTTTDRDRLFEKIFPNLELGLTLSFQLKALNQPAIDCPHTPQRLVNLLLQEIFVAANLCLPASCKFYKITYPDKKGTPPPSMYCFYFEDCARFARQDAWPQYRPISFENAWNWLMACGIHDLDIAITPVQRAVFSLLEIARYESFNIAEVLLISQALDGLLVKEGEPIQRTLSRRISSIVGAPSKHQNWVKEFYELRSDIAHGAFPIVRDHSSHEESLEISQYHEQYFVPLVRAVAALLAILQDMIITGTCEYRFEQLENISRIRVTGGQNA